MLKNIPSIITAELLTILAEMGHGDDLVLVDRNYPAESTAAETVTGTCVQLSGIGTTEAARAILSLLPLDSYVDAPVRLMAVVGDPDAVPEVHSEMQKVVNAAEGKAITIERVERFAFYEAAKSAYAVVRTSEARPHGCFIFKKGVIFD
ncbi:RbsD/FucU family protein [Aureimonas phyllosphaerae]|uniref:L-fucose mutarotase n=1 Tax=Aureimonas phyllosphaerae TaxID=1166078 RepID=A0A7W6BTS0_9HYPH|nr:RbsD/FucU domain-containing protein [Aureimonas phyllosphaerae]MBB3934918.1 L-fucose mutarotase [Aureimonas phyllosphaerae]MBB3958926.1 L-fucose mutarotase [Aureimonas phyllosphaerae]SFF40677.1 L-fucose mutarotase [Aureimonas phyllosphaerae]